MKLFFFLLLASLTTLAQESNKVMEPIHKLFEGMQKGDSAMVHRSFYKSPTFSTVMTDPKTNQPLLRVDGFQGFLKSIGTPHTEVYNELIWSPKVDIDGNFAQVWVPYGFYLGKTFHHCGVDAFQLFKEGSGEWKIFSLTDTRQTVGCKVPEEVSSKLK